MRKIKPVIQQDATGCGMACVAAVSGVPYAEVKQAARRLGISVHDPALWSETSPVLRLLKHFHVTASPQPKPFRSWASLSNAALLATKWHKERGRPFWHWAVFVRQDGVSRVLDSKKSLRNHSRTDLGRIKPKWWIKLHLLILILTLRPGWASEWVTMPVDQLETAQGLLKIDQVGKNGYPIHVAGRFIAELEADNVRISSSLPTAQAPQYVLLDVSKGGGSCPQVFQLVDLTPGRKPEITHEFGNCSDSPNFRMESETPVIEFSKNDDFQTETYLYDPGRRRLRVRRLTMEKK